MEALACDPVLYLGLGKQSPGESGWTLIDDQLQPIRGFGTHGTPQEPLLSPQQVLREGV